VIPAAHDRAFLSGGNHIENIPTAGRRVGLRIYVSSALPWCGLTLRTRSHGDGAVLGEQHFNVLRDEMYENGDLRATYGDAALARPHVDVEIATSADCRVWLFATTADENGQTEVHLPVSGTGL
jgi:hypothetical protein